MKRLLLVFAGFILGMAHAQTVDWNRVRASCSSEISAYDAVRGTGDTSSQALRYLETEAASPAKLRDLLEKQRASLSDAYLMKTPAFRNSALMYVCAATAALNQLQSGSTQSAAAAPSRPASPPPSTRGSGRNQPDKVAAHCMDDVQSQPGVIRNTCNQKVSMRWCSLSYGPNACGSGNLGWADVPPGGTAVVDRDVKILMIACAAPTRPTDIEYTPGGGFLYNCTQ